ncbi:MAG: CDP-diacylglycerol--glycerol-3-phosphate 3-phosphatidyltransferase [Planctomycetota bacterium]|nr:MAG: CDP-diacylglycerol--glycerol-3-phosphate 3-phosphatidyltransferase [Planctomycetota bacterium]
MHRMPHTQPPHASFKGRLPNVLTIARVGLALGVIALLSGPIDPPTDPDGLTTQQNLLLLTLSLFLLAALTDAADGYLARKWNVVSLFGRVIDPFADKILILGTFICLAGPTFADPRGGIATGVHPWMVVLILARELLVTTLRGVYESQGVDFSATRSGKLKMIFQSLAIPAVLAILALDPAEPGSPTRHAIDLIVWATLLVTIWSGLPYVLRAWRAPNSGEKP